jgi:hypothetical protein
MSDRQDFKDDPDFKALAELANEIEDGELIALVAFGTLKRLQLDQPELYRRPDAIPLAFSSSADAIEQAKRDGRLLPLAQDSCDPSRVG